VLRTQLTPLEEARAVAAILEQGYTPGGAATVLGWAKQRVTARAKILERRGLHPAGGDHQGTRLRPRPRDRPTADSRAGGSGLVQHGLPPPGCEAVRRAGLPELYGSWNSTEADRFLWICTLRRDLRARDPAVDFDVAASHARDVSRHVRSRREFRRGASRPLPQRGT
jgi:hypothetical protein